jgi:hypothetical protein
MLIHRNCWRQCADSRLLLAERIIPRAAAGQAVRHQHDGDAAARNATRASQHPGGDGL